MRLFANPLFLLLPLLIAFGAPAAAQTRLKVVGSSTQQPLIAALAKRFEALRPGTSIQVEAGGSQRGVDEVRKGQADIGMVSRPLNDAERDLLAFAVARDGVGFIVHKDNPVSQLTTAQLRNIYTARVTRWQEVGGANSPLMALTREKGRSSRDLFLHYFNLKEDELKAAIVAGENALVVDAVMRDPRAIAYLSIGEAQRKAESGLPIKILAIDGSAGTAKNVRKGSYPLLRPLTLVTRQLPQGTAKEFIEFCLSSQATPIVQEHDFVPYID